MKKLTHTDEKGKAVMVDIGEKPVQTRIAIATGKISLGSETVRLIRENQMKKGDVLTVAQIAGISGAKQTASLIPLCHNLEKVDVKMHLMADAVTSTAEVHCSGKTGVEMEALTAVGISLLTVYDMCKAVDKNMIISDIRLVQKIKE
jgi:cyclic pyranopterin monophosphate synthase